MYWLQEVCSEVSIFWVHANNAEGLRQSYASIAQVFEIPGYEDSEVDIMLLVKRWLERKDRGQWLMVIDDVNDPQVFFDRSMAVSTSSQQEDLEHYIPQCAHGSILITTRNKQASLSLPNGALSIEVREMHENESEGLLHAMLEGVNVASSDLATLSSRLQHVPIALVQAAAFIKEKSITVNEYLRLLNVGDSEDRAVLKTWKLSFEEIQREDAFASELLSVMSFFDRQAIPLDFLADYSKQQQEPKGALLLNKAIGVLEAFSFVTKKKDNGLDMHRLVQLATRNWLVKMGTVGHFAGQALLAVSHCYPYGRHENRAVCGAYLAHAYVVLGGDGTGSRDEGLAKAALLHSVAGFFDYRGQWKDAEGFQKEAIDIRGDLLGPEHPDTLSSMANLASTYRNQGRWEEAENLEVQVMETRKTKLGADHPSTLTSMANLASTYWNQGRWEEAEKLEVQVMETRKTKLGADHPSTLTSMANLASTYRNQGRWEEAKNLEVQVMETSKTKLGADHPSTLTSMANL
ncbi:tetratricopeptide repeat protein, partial [Candidatus Bathyarchaeota archaeon]|nr:tetratricopeptide repeat protein [Candidatus Bathyarchaeota archaeon]